VVEFFCKWFQNIYICLTKTEPIGIGFLIISLVIKHTNYCRMNKSVRRFKLRILKKMTFLPSSLYAGFAYEYFNGKKLNLKNPKEFNEKIQWYKVFYRPKILTQLVDKYEVRFYVEKKIGQKYLNELFGVYDKASEVNFDELPEEFILKATHSSSHNLIVHDKSKVDQFKAKKKFLKWLRTNQYYRTGQEWAYKNIRPRIIAEKLLKEEGQSSLVDYKFYCFKGVAKFIEIHLDRAENHKRAFYDLNLEKLPFRNVSLKKSIDKEVEKPKALGEMIMLAEVLADKFPFVRVDFYYVQSKIIFGEMTFYPSDGRKDFYPEEYNKIVGSYMDLPNTPKGAKKIKQI